MSNRMWIWRYARRVKGYLAFTTILFVLEMLANIGVVGIQKFIVDDLFVRQKSDLLVPLLAGLAGLAVAYNVLHLYAALMRNKAEFKLQRLLVRDMLHYLHRIPVRLFRKERTGKYMSNLTEDINQTAGLVGNRLPVGIMEICGAVVLSAVIGFASPLLLVFVLAVSVIYIALGNYFAPKVKKAGKEVSATQSDVLVTIEEGIASSREVIAFHRQQWESGRFRSRLSVHFANLMNQVNIQNRQALYSLILQWSIRLTVLGYGGYMVMQDRLSIGWLVVVFQFASQLMGSYEKVYGFFMGLAGSMAAVDRVREVMDGESDPEGAAPLSGPIFSLSLEKIGFRYEADGNPVLQGVDIDIPVGKKVAFVGTSGGGKSTIAQLLIRFYEPDAGRIAVNGEPLTHFRRDDWLKRVSIVFQEAYLFPDSIRNNLLMGRNVSEDKMKKICAGMQIHDFIESLQDGYNTQAGERGIQLSGGQRQRIALARALLADSDILILDEATSALDLETERQVQQQLDELRRGKTTIVVAHRLSTVMNADVIYVLKEGCVSEQGTHDKLLSQGNVYPQLVLAAD